MLHFVTGDLLDAPAEALVNTVNAVGVMGKGIALMFKEAFPENFRAYEEACRRKEMKVGQMFVTENLALEGPRWIINFPSKQHWRHPSKLEWIVDGLQDLCRVIEANKIRSIALPPLGCGNGGLDWAVVRPHIEQALADLQDVTILVFEPTEKYPNVAKRTGVMKLTPARALIAGMVRRYWVLGIECTYLEVQKLGWFLGRTISELGVADPLNLQFSADKYGPYSDRLRHMLNDLDGSYLHCDTRLSAKGAVSASCRFKTSPAPHSVLRVRLSDAGPSDTIWFDEERHPFLDVYLKQEDMRPLQRILDRTADRIDGYQSPLGMELLATVDWLLEREDCPATIEGIRQGLANWPAGPAAADRKQRLFDDRLIGLALHQLRSCN